MGRHNMLDMGAHGGRLLLGYYGDGYYGNNDACYNRAGCLAGSIIGAVVFALIALALLICVCIRLRARRAAAAQGPYVYPQTTYPPAQQYGNGADNQYPQGGNPYYSQGQPEYSNQQPPHNFSSAAEREAWERDQYAKYGEAGVAVGVPAGEAGPSSGVQMSNMK